MKRKYSIPKEMAVAFHNGSNESMIIDDYHNESIIIILS